MKLSANEAIRPYQAADEAKVIQLWHRSGQAAYSYLPSWQAFTLEEAKTVFRAVILPKCKLWVGVKDSQILAYLALNDSYIDRLYVEPDAQHKAWGSRLLNYAKQLKPYGLELHTHQENYLARTFYEKHGFIAVKFGISPAPEQAPDVEYHWRPK
jgi:ribosomal protein S18 acetylase RimI-like enzyme